MNKKTINIFLILFFSFSIAQASSSTGSISGTKKSIIKNESTNSFWDILPGEVKTKIFNCPTIKKKVVNYVLGKKERLNAKLINKNTLVSAKNACFGLTVQALKLSFLYPHLTDVRLLVKEKNDFYGALKRNWEPSTKTKNAINSLVSDSNTRTWFYREVLENILTPYFYSDVCLSLFSLDHKNYDQKLNQESPFSVPIKIIQLRQQQEKYKNQHSVDTVFLTQINKNTFNTVEFRSLMEKVCAEIKKTIFLNNQNIKNVRIVLDTKDKILSPNECIHMIDSFNELCLQELSENEKERIKIFDLTPIFTTTFIQGKYFQDDVNKIIDLIRRIHTLLPKVTVFLPVSFRYIIFYHKLFPDLVMLSPDYINYHPYKTNYDLYGTDVKQRYENDNEAVDHDDLSNELGKFNLTLNVESADLYCVNNRPSPLTKLPYSHGLVIDHFLQKEIWSLIRSKCSDEYIYGCSKDDFFKYCEKNYDLNLYSSQNETGNTLLHNYRNNLKMIRLLHEHLSIDINALNKKHQNFVTVLLNDTLPTLYQQIKENQPRYYCGTAYIGFLFENKLVSAISDTINEITSILNYFFENGGTLIDYHGDTIFLKSLMKFLNENSYFDKIKNIITQQYPFLNKN